MKTLLHKIRAKFELLVLRPIDWRYWKPAAFGAVEMHTDSVATLTERLGYTFRNEQDKAFFEHRFSGYDAEISNVVLDARNGWVISGKQIHPLSFFNINDPYDGRKPYPSVLRFTMAKLFARVMPVEEVVWLPRLWNNYYHFVAELLPVLLALKRSGQPATVLGCAAADYPYVQFFAEQMQLQHSIRLLPVDKSRFYRARVVRLKKQPLFDPEFLKDIADFIADDANGHLPGQSEKVFIYRKGMRSLRNNQDLLDILQRRGFYCFDPGDHPVAGQVAALKRATVVVGVHGAGLTNMLFSGRLQHVIELMPGNMKPNHYREIAVIKGAAYQCLQGTPLDEQLMFSIQPAQVVEALQQTEA